MKPWHDYSHTIASIAHSFVSVCKYAMTPEDLDQWAKGEITPNDRMDANLVLDGIIEDHGIQLWTDGHMNDDALRFFNQCYDAANDLNQSLRK